MPVYKTAFSTFPLLLTKQLILPVLLLLLLFFFRHQTNLLRLTTRLRGSIPDQTQRFRPNVIKSGAEGASENTHLTHIHWPLLADDLILKCVFLWDGILYLAHSSISQHLC